MKAFHGSSQVKQFYINRIIEAKKQGLLQKHFPWIAGLGSGFTSTLIQGGSEKRLKFETELGLPLWFVSLLDPIYDTMPDSDSHEFAVHILEKIKPGVKLSMLKNEYLLTLCEMLKNDYNKSWHNQSSITPVIELCKGNGSAKKLSEKYLEVITKEANRARCMQKQAESEKRPNHNNHKRVMENVLLAQALREICEVLIEDNKPRYDLSCILFLVKGKSTAENAFRHRDNLYDFLDRNT